VRSDANVFGSGDVRVEYYGVLRLQNPTNNVAPGAKVRLAARAPG